MHLSAVPEWAWLFGNPSSDFYSNTSLEVGQDHMDFTPYSSCLYRVPKVIHKQLQGEYQWVQWH
eukprot:1142734-Pelagomonas_calceolata.AAC.5